MSNFHLRWARSLTVPLRFLLEIFHSIIYGAARWMNAAEKKLFFAPQNKGLILGRYGVVKKKSIGIEELIPFLFLIVA